jgi:hypothetical protein
MATYPPPAYLVTADTLRAALTEITVERSRLPMGATHWVQHEDIAAMRVHARELGADRTCSTESCWSCIVAYAVRPDLTEQLPAQEPR